MTNDTERWEVARRLRDIRLKPWDDPACEIVLCVGAVCCNSECHGSDENPECAMALCDRLADLIEPYCDHDALLELADEFDAQGDYIASAIEDSDGDFDRHAIDAMGERYGYARRIREALGVADG